MLLAFLVALVFSFVGSMPIAGPISALVFRSGLRQGYRNGFNIALGASVAEGLYALGAFWGLSTVLVRYPVLEQVAGGVVAVLFLVLGAVFLFRRYETPADDVQGDYRRRSLVLGFTVTALNPTLLATWAAATAFLHASKLLTAAPRNAPFFALGVVLGIVAWFGLMLELMKRHHHRLSPAWMRRLQQMVGLILASMGGVFGWRFVAFLAHGVARGN